MRRVGSSRLTIAALLLAASCGQSGESFEFEQDDFLRELQGLEAVGDDVVECTNETRGADAFSPTLRAFVECTDADVRRAVIVELFGEDSRFIEEAVIALPDGADSAAFAECIVEGISEAGRESVEAIWEEATSARSFGERVGSLAGAQCADELVDGLVPDVLVTASDLFEAMIGATGVDVEAVTPTTVDTEGTTIWFTEIPIQFALVVPEGTEVILSTQLTLSRPATSEEIAAGEVMLEAFGFADVDLLEATEGGRQEWQSGDLVACLGDPGTNGLRVLPAALGC